MARVLGVRRRARSELLNQKKTQMAGHLRVSCIHAMFHATYSTSARPCACAGGARRRAGLGRGLRRRDVATLPSRRDDGGVRLHGALGSLVEWYGLIRRTEIVRRNGTAYYCGRMHSIGLIARLDRFAAYCGLVAWHTSSQAATQRRLSQFGSRIAALTTTLVTGSRGCGAEAQNCSRAARS